MIRRLALFFKTEQFGLFDQPVQVRGHVRRTGAYVAPYQAKRKKRQPITVDPQQRHTADLFADLDTKVDALPIAPPLQRRMKEAVSMFYRHGVKGSLVALGIANEWRDTGKFSLLGHKIQSPRDLAVLAQAYRNPGFETLRYILMNDEGTVVHTTAVSSRAPAASAAFVGKFEDFVADMKATMDKTGATKYMLLHNHPSGQVNASSADRGFTRLMMANLPGFQAHVIIDHNVYTELTPEVLRGAGVVPVETQHPLDMGDDPLDKPSAPHSVLGSVINSPSQAAKIAKIVQENKRCGVLIGVDNRLGVRSVIDLPDEVLSGRRAKRSLAFLRRLATAGAGARFFLALPHEMYKEHALKTDSPIAKWYGLNWLEDVVNSDYGATFARNEPKIFKETHNSPYDRSGGRPAVIRESLKKGYRP